MSNSEKQMKFWGERKFNDGDIVVVNGHPVWNNIRACIIGLSSESRGQHLPDSYIVKFLKPFIYDCSDYSDMSYRKYFGEFMEDYLQLVD